MSLLKTNEIQNYNGSSLTLTASTVSTSAQLNTGGNISVTGSLNVSDDSTTRTNLGLGTIATQDSDSITVTGGSVTGTEIDLKSSGTTIFKSDGTNAVLSESGGTVTFTADDLTVNGTSSLDGAVVINESGADVDFRIESDTNTHAFFLEGSSGNVGIGTSSPASNLHVASTTGEIIIKATASNAGTSRVFLDFSGYRTSADEGIIGGVNFINQNTTNTTIASIQGYKEGTSAIDLGYLSFYTKPTSGSLTERMRIDSSGNIGAPSGTNIYNASDQRLKQNITDLSGCLQKVLSMRGVSFNWINKFSDSEADKTLYGLIAQELQIIDSNLVDSFSDNTITAGDVAVENPLRVNEKFIIPMLVESIKEQQTLIESQQSQIDALTARIEALETT